jgi:uncharacterized membrane protein
MSAASQTRRPAPTRLAPAGLIVVAGSLALGLHLTSVLSDESLATTLISPGLWRRAVLFFGGTIAGDENRWLARLDLTGPLIAMVAAGLLAWVAGGWCIARGRGVNIRQGLARWGCLGWAWSLVPIAWEFLDLLAELMHWPGLGALIRGTLPLSMGVSFAGWIATGCALRRGPRYSPASIDPSARIPAIVWCAMALYVLVMGSLNVGLYQSLNLPHGDSAMYEEHLWNVLHGKGFRSYLDGGRLFLGEHVQVIHLLLIPVYLVWPSHLLLEWCQSLALAAGAIPVFRLALRHGGSSRAAAWLAIAYLMYVPMQFLDIAVDFKTFRPNSFEIPLFVFAFDALERRRGRAFFGALVLALFCQEDAATIIAPLGVWLSLRGQNALAPAGTQGAVEKRGLAPMQFKNGAEFHGRRGACPPLSTLGQGEKQADRLSRSVRWIGAGLTLFGILYVALVVKVVLPWFRDGADVHFAQYFNELGDSSNSIVANLVRRPDLVLARVLDPESIGFALSLLVPLGFVSLLSPGRLLVALPLFAILCLSDITNSSQHHFHAPLVPVLFWSAAAGLGRGEALLTKSISCWRWLRRAPPQEDDKRRIPPEHYVPTAKTLPVSISVQRQSGPLRPTTIAETAARWCALCAATTGLFLGLSPATIGFWDVDSRAYWQTHYVPGARARHFPAVLARIPPDRRVASTDYIHPRFTHHERSYDYSAYRPDVPDDAEFIVIDAKHPFSRISRPEDVDEYRDRPDLWEPLDDTTQGHFIILRRRQR